MLLHCCVDDGGKLRYGRIGGGLHVIVATVSGVVDPLGEVERATAGPAQGLLAFRVDAVRPGAEVDEQRVRCGLRIVPDLAPVRDAAVVQAAKQRAGLEMPARSLLGLVLGNLRHLAQDGRLKPLRQLQKLPLQGINAVDLDLNGHDCYLPPSCKYFSRPGSGGL